MPSLSRVGNRGKSTSLRSANRHEFAIGKKESGTRQLSEIMKQRKRKGKVAAKDTVIGNSFF
jgi:hypothetical protein